MVSIKWESIQSESNMSRAKVFGGWIIRESTSGYQEGSTTLVFVPDPKHEWKSDIDIL